jgi:hypothetical protein
VRVICNPRLTNKKRLQCIGKENVMAKRKLENPTNPEPVAMLVKTFHRLGEAAANRTEAENRVSALLNTPARREAAQRLVQHFNRIPWERRVQAFGAEAELDNQPVSVERLKQAFGKIKSSAAVAVVNDDVGPVIVPPASPLDRFTLSFTGLYCQQESDWDEFTDSDEAYAVTTVLEVVNGANVVRAEKHPYNQLEYGDIDTGEWRTGPVAACWSGTAKEISLITTVMERDQGDPNKYKDEIEVIVSAGTDILDYLKIDTDLLKKLKDLIVDAINWLLGTGDDLIETQYRIISADDLKLHAAATPHVLIGKRKETVYTFPPGSLSPSFQTKEVTDVTDIPKNFTTVHRGSGATYVVGYRVSKKTIPVPVHPIN